MTVTGTFPAITASIGGKQRRLTLERQWHRAIESQELDRSTPVHYEPSPGCGAVVEAGDCPELVPLFDEIRGALPEPQSLESNPVAAAVPPPSARLAQLGAEVATMPASPAASRRKRPVSAVLSKPDFVNTPGPLSANAVARSAPGWAWYALTRYAVFEGRSQRSEYWNFQLLVMLPIFIGIMAAAVADSATLAGLLVLVLLGLFIPSLAATVRRLHDRDLSVWLVIVFTLLSLIPVVGFLFSLGFCFVLALPGTDGPNQHGPDPKG